LNLKVFGAFQRQILPSQRRAPQSRNRGAADERLRRSYL
jgi:hypothetical protein